MFKLIFDWIVDQYTLFENPLYNWIGMGIIGVIGFVIAFRFVGALYDDGLISGRFLGKIFHWTIRLIVVSLLVVAVGGIIWVIKTIGGLFA
jgi:hypothetical protein